MKYGDAALAYQLTAAQSASPMGLVVMLYDGALDRMHRALRAIEEGNVEQRSQELTRVLDIIGELQGSLDMERGGEVARRLGRFYEISRGKVLEASIRASREELHALIAQFQSMREAWHQVEQDVNRSNQGEAPPRSSVQPAEPEAVTSGDWSV